MANQLQIPDRCTDRQIELMPVDDAVKRGTLCLPFTGQNEEVFVLREHNATQLRRTCEEIHVVAFCAAVIKCGDSINSPRRKPSVTAA